MQLELFPLPKLSEPEWLEIRAAIYGHYWHIRNLKRGQHTQAKLRKRYREVEQQKKRLLLAGVPKSDVLQLLRHCRCQCSATKPPFQPCKFCF